MRLHVPACPPSSPLHTATSHTLSLLHTVLHSHVPLLAHTWFHSHGVSLTHTILLTLAVSSMRTLSLTLAVSVTRGVLGSTHLGTLATTPLTHGVSVTHAVALTHALAPTLCARCSTHFTTLVYTPRHHTHRDIHTGESCHHKGSRGLHTPQAPRAPIHSTRLLYLAWHDRTHLVAISFKGE